MKIKDNRLFLFLTYTACWWGPGLWEVNESIYVPLIGQCFAQKCLSVHLNPNEGQLVAAGVFGGGGVDCVHTF